MEAIAAGGALDDDENELLSMVVARLRFTPICERSIEGRHRITKQCLARAPHAGPAYISLQGRQPEIDKPMKLNLLSLEDLGEKCRQVRGRETH